MQVRYCGGILKASFEVNNSLIVLGLLCSVQYEDPPMKNNLYVTYSVCHSPFYSSSSIPQVFHWVTSLIRSIWERKTISHKSIFGNQQEGYKSKIVINGRYNMGTQWDTCWIKIWQKEGNNTPSFDHFVFCKKMTSGNYLECYSTQQQYIVNYIIVYYFPP